MATAAKIDVAGDASQSGIVAKKSVLRHMTGYAGKMNSGVITKKGGLITWGLNEHIRLVGEGDKPVPLSVPGVLAFKLVSVGISQFAAIARDGTLWTWGAGSSGRLGHGTDESVGAPQQVETLAGIKMVWTAAGPGQHICAVSADGILYMWGSGTYGRLGNGSTRPQYIPSAVTALSDEYIVCAMTDDHTLALSARGEVYSWGRGVGLGHGTHEDNFLPRLVTGLHGHYITSIAVGSGYSCAIDDHGKLFTWGSGRHGRIGHGSTEDCLSPRRVSALKDVFVSAVSTGVRHTLVISDDGIVYSFGCGEYGQLGHGDGNDQHSPRIIESLSKQVIVNVAAGESHSIAVSNRGEAFSWGAGGGGRLGLGGTKGVSIARKITALKQYPPVIGFFKQEVPDIKPEYPSTSSSVSSLSTPDSGGNSSSDRAQQDNRFPAVAADTSPFPSSNNNNPPPSPMNTMPSPRATSPRTIGVNNDSNVRNDGTPKNIRDGMKGLLLSASSPFSPFATETTNTTTTTTTTETDESKFPSPLPSPNESKFAIRPKDQHQQRQQHYIDSELLADVDEPVLTGDSEVDDFDYESLPIDNVALIPPSLPKPKIEVQKSPAPSSPKHEASPVLVVAEEQPPQQPATQEENGGPTEEEGEETFQQQQDETAESESERRRERRKSRSQKTSDEIVAELMNSRDILIPPKHLKFNRVIGEGSSGIVYLGELYNTPVAIKRLKGAAMVGGGANTVDWQQEFETLKALRHPNIVLFIGVALSPKPLCVVTEHCSHGSLYDVIHKHKIRIPPRQVHSILRSTACGMSYLHCRTPKIIHRDIKSGNLLLTSSWEVKIGDFGLSRVKSEFSTQTKTQSVVGTPLWMAPEVMRGDMYGEKCDVYSYAIVMWEIFARKIPFEGMDAVQVMFKVVVNHQRPSLESIPVSYRPLLMSCWDKDPAKRPSFVEIMHHLDEIEKIEGPKWSAV